MGIFERGGRRGPANRKREGTLEGGRGDEKRKEKQSNKPTNTRNSRLGNPRLLEAEEHEPASRQLLLDVASNWTVQGKLGLLRVGTLGSNGPPTRERLESDRPPKSNSLPIRTSSCPEERSSMQSFDTFPGQPCPC